MSCSGSVYVERHLRERDAGGTGGDSRTGSAGSRRSRRTADADEQDQRQTQTQTPTPQQDADADADAARRSKQQQQQTQTQQNAERQSQLNAESSTADADAGRNATQQDAAAAEQQSRRSRTQKQTPPAAEQTSRRRRQQDGRAGSAEAATQTQQTQSMGLHHIVITKPIVNSSIVGLVTRKDLMVHKSEVTFYEKMITNAYEPPGPVPACGSLDPDLPGEPCMEVGTTRAIILEGSEGQPHTMAIRPSSGATSFTSERQGTPSTVSHPIPFPGMQSPLSTVSHVSHPSSPPYALPSSPSNSLLTSPLKDCPTRSPQASSSGGNDGGGIAGGGGNGGGGAGTRTPQASSLLNSPRSESNTDHVPGHLKDLGHGQGQGHVQDPSLAQGQGQVQGQDHTQGQGHVQDPSLAQGQDHAQGLDNITSALVHNIGEVTAEDRRAVVGTSPYLFFTSGASPPSSVGSSRRRYLTISNPMVTASTAPQIANDLGGVRVGQTSFLRPPSLDGIHQNVQNLQQIQDDLNQSKAKMQKLMQNPKDLLGTTSSGGVKVEEMFMRSFVPNPDAAPPSDGSVRVDMSQVAPQRRPCRVRSAGTPVNQPSSARSVGTPQKRLSGSSIRVRTAGSAPLPTIGASSAVASSASRAPVGGVPPVLSTSSVGRTDFGVSAVPQRPPHQFAPVNLEPVRGLNIGNTGGNDVVLAVVGVQVHSPVVNRAPITGSHRPSATSLLPASTARRTRELDMMRKNTLRVLFACCAVAGASLAVEGASTSGMRNLLTNPQPNPNRFPPYGCDPNLAKSPFVLDPMYYYAASNIACVTVRTKTPTVPGPCNDMDFYALVLQTPTVPGPCNDMDFYALVLQVAPICRDGITKVTVNGRETVRPTFETFSDSKALLKMPRINLNISNADGAEICMTLNSKRCSTMDTLCHYGDGTCDYSIMQSGACVCCPDQVEKAFIGDNPLYTFTFNVVAPFDDTNPCSDSDLYKIEFWTPLRCQNAVKGAYVNGGKRTANFDRSTGVWSVPKLNFNQTTAAGATVALELDADGPCSTLSELCNKKGGRWFMGKRM
eukprot:gene19936-26642_t